MLSTEAFWQQSVAAALAELTRRVQSGATVAATLRWLLERFVVRPHERIAYSKLPDFTFRFRWDDGRLRFVDKGVGRFRRAGIRHAPLRRITHDLGLWTGGDCPRLTAAGRAFVSEVLT